ncbi:Ppx/GppA family phosphatase [Sulfurimonas sp.]|nr:Ppx/GppA family phosphatase [Sulfurimonas sp.]
MAKRVAVIDIGSNSIRMVVYEKTSRFAFHILHEIKSRVRLSENAYQNSNNLQTDPMQRTYDALEGFLSIISSYKARKTLCVATSALRDAPNKKEFLDRVRIGLGLKIKIIDGEKESYFGAVACANLLPEQENALSIDIGGGSTEFSLINKKEINNNLSLKLGTVRLKELFFDKQDRDGAIKYIDSQLDSLDNVNISTIIGIGGSFRAISEILLSRENYPLKKLHAYESSSDKFKNLLKDILNANEDELKEIGIKKSRVDVIKPGALILQRVLKKFKVNNLITSGVGVREGVYLNDLLRNSKDKMPVNYNTSLRYILDSHVDNKEYSNNLNKLVKQIFDITYAKLDIDKKYRYELGVAAKICMSGSNIHTYSEYKHSYHLIQDALEFGFTHKQTTLIATLVKYAKRKRPSNLHVEKYSSLLPDSPTLNTLSYILSLSISLLAHKPKNIDFSLEFAKNELVISTKKSLYLAKESIKKIDPLDNLTVKIT